MNKLDKRLTQDLFAEYAKHAIRKAYKGMRKDISGLEGFAWQSNVLGRWCFIPIKKDFNLDNVIVVHRRSLYNA